MAESEQMNKTTQSSPSQSILIEMFGQKLQLYVDGKLIKLWPKDANLLALLALGGGKVKRKSLIEALWNAQERLEQNCAGLLKQSLSHLRRVFGSKRLPAYIREEVVFNLDNVTADTLSFEKSFSGGTVSGMKTAVSLYKEGLLLDCYEDWAVDKQRQFEQMYVSAVLAVAEYEFSEKNFSAALYYIERAIETAVFGADLTLLEDLQDKVKEQQKTAFTSPYFGIHEIIQNLDEYLQPHPSPVVPIKSSEIDRYLGRLKLMEPPANVLMTISRELAKSNEDTEENRIQVLRLVLEQLPEYHPYAEAHESVRQWVRRLNTPVAENEKMAESYEYANFIKAMFSDKSTRPLYIPSYNSKQIRTWRIFVELFPDASLRVLSHIIKYSADVQKLAASFGLIATIANINDDKFNGDIIDLFDLFEERLGGGKNLALDGDEYMLRRQYHYSRAEASRAEEDIKAINDFRSIRIEQDFTVDRFYYNCTTDEMLAEVTESKLLYPVERHLVMREFSIATLEHLLGKHSLISPERREKLEKITL